MATHFAIVLGAWRLRIRIDLDEPRASEIDEAPRALARGPGEEPGCASAPHVAARGRG
ncbi:MAG TPA: hypothetical protein VHT53_13955 [Candidatus Elarobacter sp.]|jgi:hypothetical protein|nr:hypothetical protein [Candidatus Elarobacter sp.]